MKTLEWKQIKDYLDCPMVYKFKYRDKVKVEILKTEKDIQYEAYKKVVLYFYFSLLNGEPLDKLDLMSKWYSLTKPKKQSRSIEDILFGKTTKANDTGVTSFFAKKLNNFFDKNTRQKFAPILVNSELNTRIGNCIVKVPIDLVKEVRIKGRKTPALELYHMPTEFVNTDQFFADNDLYVTLMSHVFRDVFGRKETFITIDNFRGSQTKQTVRSPEKIKEDMEHIKIITENILSGNFYKRAGYNCSGCLYKEHCSNSKLKG